MSESKDLSLKVDNNGHSCETAVERVEDVEQHGENAEENAVQQIHAKTIILLIAIVAIYFVQVLHLAGSGLLASTITAVTGGATQSIWLTAALGISAAALGAPVSQASDFWGRKWFTVGFSALGFIGCLIVSRATNFGMVIGGQSIACLALGAQPLVHAIASEIVPRKYRSLAQSAVNVASASGGLTGIMIGGALVRFNPEGFRIYFYITAALYGATAAIVLWLYNPPPRQLQIELRQTQKLAQLDWYGYLLFVPGLILFSYALTSSSGVYPWSSSKIIGPLVVGVLLLVMFIVYEWKLLASGMLHHGLFSKGRNFPICVALIFTEGLAFFAANTFYAYENAVLYDQDFFHAGLRFTVVFWSANVATILTGLYVSRTKQLRLPLIVATSFITLFFATMASLTPSTPQSPIGFAVFLGLGLGSALNTVVVTAQLSTPPDLIALASGLMIAMRSTGGTVGLSIFQALLSNALSKQLPEKVLGQVIPLGFDTGYTGVLLDGLGAQNGTLLESIPGITPQIITAAVVGVKEAYSISFRRVWIAAAAFAAVATLLSCFIVDNKQEFTMHIDAPVESEAELSRR
ncbi:hypothetical protein LTR84_002740 [Exophiala bonariae]|uniref:Major facilitator superfamily (MFS) profile domain-containing protein n=1 Tax=Exophiala bonariae TaxID=1690606 RepID=A0AAV9NCC4_9EURO|nr:hypothetical protein LTR84_002740 [Exophiala bonariae]